MFFRMSLSYDATFLSIFLDGYSTKLESCQFRCLFVPFGRRRELKCNIAVLDYAVKVPIVDVKVDRGLKTVISAPYYFQDGDERDPYALPGEGYEYWLNSQSISEIGLEETIHMGDYVYRIVKKDAVLIADSRTEFIDETAQMYGDETRPQNSLETYLQSYVGNPIAYGHSPDASKVLQISITGNHIDQAVDMFENYVG